MPDRTVCHPSAVIGATVGIKVGDGFSAGRVAVRLGVIVASGVRIGNHGAAKVGKGDEAASAGAQAASTRQ